MVESLVIRFGSLVLSSPPLLLFFDVVNDGSLGPGVLVLPLPPESPDPGVVVPD